MKCKILITGGAGFIGSSLADRLIQDPDNYVVLADNMLTGKESNLPDPAAKNWTFIHCDVNSPSDLQQLMVSHSFDYVFHYAAVVGVQRTLQYPIKVLDDIEGIRNILDLSKNTGVKRILYASSSEVYGESISYPQDEVKTPLNSRLPYAIVKNVGEAFCKSYKQAYGLDYTIFRFFNTYGPKQSRDFVVSKFLRAAINDEDITVHGDGSQSRTFCFIDDHIDATLAAFKSEEAKNDVLNIGNEDEVSILQLAEAIINITDSKSRIVHLPPLEEGDMRRRVPNSHKMKKLLQRDMLRLEEGLDRIVQNIEKKVNG